MLRRPTQIERHNSIDEPEQSGDNDDSSISSDTSMNDEEAEKTVEELLAKYTTLGSVVERRA